MGIWNAIECWFLPRLVLGRLSDDLQDDLQQFNVGMGKAMGHVLLPREVQHLESAYEALNSPVWLLPQRPHSQLWGINQVPWGRDVQRHDMEAAHRQNSEKRKQHPGLSATQFKSQQWRGEECCSACRSTVCPTLEYCSTIWVPYQKDQIYKLGDGPEEYR